MGFWSFSLDAYSAVWQDCKFSDFLKYYHLDSVWLGFFEDCAPKVSNLVYGDFVRFEFQGIVISFYLTDWQDAFSEGDVDKLYNSHFRKIQFLSMGRGLAYLRSLGLDIDSDNSILRVFSPSMHVTRVDFAFDFVNYSLDFDLFEMFGKFVSRPDCLSEQGRLCVRGRKAGLSFTRKYGSSEKTFYIGSSSSERLLRVYDKYLERKQASGGLFTDSRFGDPAGVTSWIRAELQTRKVLAEKFLFADNFSASGILKDISDFYQIYRRSDNSFFRSFIRYFDPVEVEKHLIYKSSNFVSKSVAEKNDDFFDRMVIQRLLHHFRHGVYSDYLADCKFLSDLQEPCSDPDKEQIRQAQLFKLTKLLCSVSPTGDLSGVPYLIIKNGKIYLSDWKV